MNTVLWAVGGVLLLVVVAIGWVAGMVTRNRGRRRALMFADTMLGNADAIKASVAAGYPLTECLAVLDAFYKVHSPSTMLDVPTLVNMLRKRREADGGVATGINTVSSTVYSRMRHLLSPRGDRSSAASSCSTLPMCCSRSVSLFSPPPHLFVSSLYRFGSLLPKQPPLHRLPFAPTVFHEAVSMTYLPLQMQRYVPLAQLYLQ